MPNYLIDSKKNLIKESSSGTVTKTSLNIGTVSGTFISGLGIMSFFSNLSETKIISIILRESTETFICTYYDASTASDGRFGSMYLTFPLRRNNKPANLYLLLNGDGSLTKHLYDNEGTEYTESLANCILDVYMVS